MKGPYEALQAPAVDSFQRASTGELDTYYDKAIAHICNADSILIMGRGVPSMSCKSEWEKIGLGPGWVGVETVDNLTEPQLAAKIRQHFSA